MIKYKFLISTLAIAISCISFTFADEEKLMKEILKIIKDIPQQIHKTNASDLVKFRYSVQAVQADGERAIETSIFYKRGNRLCVKAGKVIYFLDEKNMFLILPFEKTIVHQKRMLTEEEKKGNAKSNLLKYEAMLNFQQTLLSRARVTGVSQIEEAGKQLTKVTFIPDQTVEELKQIRQVQIWYDRKKMEIKRIWTHYHADYKLTEMIMTYEELDYNSSDKELKSDISDYVINKNNQPIGPYKGYRLIEE